MSDSQKMPSIDEVFRLVTLDPHRKVKVTIELRDKDGDEVPIAETVQKISQYVADKMADPEANTCRQQIFPLSAQAMVLSLARLLGPELTSLLISQDQIRYSFVHVMMVGFYILQFLRSKDIKVHTIEEAVSDEDIATFHRVNKASGVLTLARHMGVDSREVVRELLRTGNITQEDLKTLGAESIDVEDVPPREPSRGAN